MVCGVNNAGGHVGHIARTIIIQHLDRQDFAVRADAGDSDAVVGDGSRDASNVCPVPEAVFHFTSKAIFANDFRSEVWVSIIYSSIDDCNYGGRISLSNIPSGGRRDGGR